MELARRTAFMLRASDEAKRELAALDAPGIDTEPQLISEPEPETVTEAPEPYYAHFQNWTKEPWGAGWHAFTAGNNDNLLIPQILQPLPEENIFICGECWSNVQGWVQGALNTSEVMLETKLGLAPPTWLDLNGTWLGPGDPRDPLDTF